MKEAFDVHTLWGVHDWSCVYAWKECGVKEKGLPPKANADLDTNPSSKHIIHVNLPSCLSTLLRVKMAQGEDTKAPSLSILDLGLQEEN